MKKADLGQVVTILANVGVLGGIVFLAYELRQNTISIDNQADIAVTEIGFSQLNLLIADPELVELSARWETVPWDEFSEMDKQRSSLFWSGLLDRVGLQYQLSLRRGIPLDRETITFPERLIASVAFRDWWDGYRSDPTVSRELVEFFDAYVVEVSGRQDQILGRGTISETSEFRSVIEHRFIAASAAPPNKCMELTVKSVMSFAKRRAKATPLFPAAHAGRQVAVMDARVFDVDGTLLESFETDCDLFVIAVKKVLGVTDVSTDWSSYPHVTDQGVVREIMRINGIAPNQELFDAVEQEFVSALKAHIHIAGPFREIPGAKEFVSRLVASDRHYVAYATGAWRASALLKLKSAGFPVDGIRVSTSSEHEDRVSIMRSAVAEIPRDPETITYYGDGMWDLTASRELGWHFVPVGAALNGIRHFNEIAAQPTGVVLTRKKAGT